MTLFSVRPHIDDDIRIFWSLDIRAQMSKIRDSKRDVDDIVRATTRNVGSSLVSRGLNARPDTICLECRPQRSGDRDQRLDIRH